MKETKSIADAGMFGRIFIGAIFRDDLEEHESLDSSREVWRAPVRMNGFADGSLWKVFKILEWTFKIFFRFRQADIAVVHCHGLATLPIGILFRLFKKSRIVYDAHELETEREGMSFLRRRLSKIAERIFIKFTDAVMVVSDSIAGWYKDRYGLRQIYIVKNIPYGRQVAGESDLLKKRFDIPPNEMLFLYQGVLDSGRGITILLEAFSKLDESDHIVFMGYGP
ncbi:MAG TPA: glycosyltransferase, partial [Spirochaetia bacterium]|nr:glycosyltransferase [Spirochaetia bacterium]